MVTCSKSFPVNDSERQIDSCRLVVYGSPASGLHELSICFKAPDCLTKYFATNPMDHGLHPKAPMLPAN
jgi:hypothetical protein